MTAIDLARLRCLGAARLPDPTALAGAAHAIGREPVRAGRDVVLGRAVDAPGPHDLDIVPSMLTNSPLVALGLCLGLAWGDHDGHPYPGHPIELSDVIDAARAMGMEAAATTHLVGAIRHVLPAAGLLEVDADVVRLGPLIAGWPEADIEVLRRNLDVLPAPKEPA